MHQKRRRNSFRNFFAILIFLFPIWFCLLSGQLELSIIIPLLQLTLKTPFNLRQHCMGKRQLRAILCSLPLLYDQ